MARLRAAALTIATFLASLLLAAGPGAATVAADSPPSDCTLPMGGSEGAINFDASRRPIGTVKAIMLFVDFPDAPALTPADTIYEDVFFPEAADWLSISSYDRLHLAVTPLRKWLRMPDPISSFAITANAIQGDDAKRYISEAVALADPDVDFSQYTIVYIVPNAEEKPLSRANARNYGPTNGVVADNTMVRSVVVFGSSVYQRGYVVLDHETGHIFGLPDYYSEDGGPAHEYIGSWSVMGDTLKADDHFAWDKWRMGWLGNDQVACLNDAVDDDYVLDPLETTDGTKALILRTGLRTAIVAEYRTAQGLDEDACSTGVLIYRVDSGIKSTHGPIRVEDSVPDSAAGTGDCPDELDDATFVEGDTFTDDDTGIEIDVTSLTDDEADLHVTRPEAYVAPVRYGGSFTFKGVRNSSGTETVTGVLTASHSFAACAVGRSVQLQEQLLGSWVTIRTANTNKLRTWTYTWTGRPGTYRLYAPEKGTSTSLCVTAASKPLVIR